MLKQRTLSSSITATGVGLHTGKKINLRINPGQPDKGIIFIRKDLSSEPIAASLKNVHDAFRPLADRPATSRARLFRDAGSRSGTGRGWLLPSTHRRS